MRFARVVRWIHRIRDLFPLTTLGVLVSLGAALLLTQVAFPALDLVLQVTGYAALVMVAVTAADVTGVTVWARHVLLSSEDDGAPRDESVVTETLRPTTTHFVARAPRWSPLVGVRWRWRSPRGVTVMPMGERRGHIHETVRFTRRGIHDHVVRRVTVRDAFGLSAISFFVRRKQHLRVEPHLGNLQAVLAQWALAAGDEHPHPLGVETGDLVDLRQYAPGDPARLIHWKVYARSERLVSRHHERALAHARRTAAYLISSARDDATAAAAWAALHQDFMSDEWVFSASGSDVITRNHAAAQRMILQSARPDVTDGKGRGLRRFVEQVDRTGPANTLLFCPPHEGPWVAEVLRVARTRRVQLVMATDGHTASDATAPLNLAHRFITQGIQAVVLDRRTGQRIALDQNRKKVA